jgi:hypothetical protein
MINLLFLLGISLHQVSAKIFTSAEMAELVTCIPVKKIWNEMTKTEFSSGFCCAVYDGKPRAGIPGIPGVHCTAAGVVTKIYWRKKNLSGPIPSEIGNVTFLETM